MADYAEVEEEQDSLRAADLQQPTQDLLDLALSEHRTRRSIATVAITAMDQCAAKPIRDQVVYNMLIQALEATVVQLHNLGLWVLKLLNAVRAGRLADFDVGGEAPASLGFTFPGEPISREDRLAAFGTVFPEAVKRGAKRPNGADIDRLKEALSKALRPIKRHRDQFVGHWDPEARSPATFGDLLEAMHSVEAVLANLWGIHIGSKHVWPAQALDASSAALSKLVLG